jgi:hypothetical protein
MTDIGKYLYLGEDGMPRYVLHKITLKPQIEIFMLLEKLGISKAGWNEEFVAAQNYEITVSLIVGVGIVNGEHERLTVLMFGETSFFLSDEGVTLSEMLGKDCLTMFFAKGCRDLGEEVGPDVREIVDEDTLKIPLNKENLKRLVSLQGEIDRDYEYKYDEENEEGVLVLCRSKAENLKDFYQDENNKRVFIKNWDDLDDLVALSQKWPWGLSFGD